METQVSRLFLLLSFALCEINTDTGFPAFVLPSSLYPFFGFLFSFFFFLCSFIVVVWCLM